MEGILGEVRGTGGVLAEGGEGILGGGVGHWWGTGIGRGEMLVREGLADDGRALGGDTGGRRGVGGLA